MSNAVQVRPVFSSNGAVAGQPVWELAYQYPLQGDWSEEEYLKLDIGQLVEFDSGFLEVLPMANALHQFIVGFLFRLLYDHVTGQKLGFVLQAPLPVRLWSKKFREPDVIFLTRRRLPDPRQPPDGADLVIEIVTEGSENRQRDLEIKKPEYARAGIQEYWIVDPEKEGITVLTLTSSNYETHGIFKPGQQASSVLLPGFGVDVTAAFAAGMGPSLQP